MKKILIILALLWSLFLVACTSDHAMTEEEQAEMYGMSLEEFREYRAAAARMNMTIDEHMNMDMNGNMDMWMPNMPGMHVIEED